MLSCSFLLAKREQTACEQWNNQVYEHIQADVNPGPMLLQYRRLW